MEEVSSLEVRIPISPRTDYFCRVRLIVESIREFYPGARIRVSVGADIEPFDLYEAQPWSADIDVEWSWVPRTEFNAWKDTAHPYIATMMERFKPPFTTEHVLMLDADVIALGSFDELFDRDHAVLGVMAHASPFVGRHCETWEHLFADYGLKSPSFDFEHSGWGTMRTDPSQRFSPPYFNTGVLLARAAVLERLYAPYVAALRFVREKMDNYFFEQVALTLALAAADIPCSTLPLRYNYPNQPAFDRVHPRELADVRLLHFLRTDVVHRDKDFENLQTMRALALRTDLTGSNEALRRRVADLLPKIFNQAH